MSPGEPAPEGGGVRVIPCVHCGVLCEVRGEVPDPGPFCCSGCEAAWHIVHGAGLDAYYAKRETPAPRPGAAPSFADLPTERLADGTEAAHLRIDGLRCSACVWVTERIVADTPGVVEATVSYATGRAELRWDPERVNLDEVLQKVAALGYTPRALDAPPARDRDLLLRLGVAAFAAVNVMMLTTGVYLGWAQGIAPRHQRLLQVFALVLATPVATWSAVPFYRGAWQGLRARVLHMDLPVSLGVVVMYVHGVLATLAGRDAYFDSLTMLVALLLGGRVVDQGGRRRARDAALALAARAPRSARRVRGEALETVSPDQLEPGDVVETAAGEEIAADGMVVDGEGLVQRALLTGESEPARVGPGDRVVAGSVLEEGSLRLRVEAAGEDTLLSRMARGVSQAAARPVQPAITDRIAPWFTGTVLGLAGLAFGGWWWAAGLDRAIEVAVAVLVVACPCALSLAAPLALASGIGGAARRGLLFRSGDGLRALARVDTVALDKTGTVTGGRLVVVEADDEVLRLAAGLERASVHPIARAIVDAASRRGIPIPLGEAVVETPGRGIAGRVDGRDLEVRSGGPGVAAVVERENGGGERVLGRILLRDALREDAPAAVARMREMGLRVVLLTGDAEAVARRIGEAAGVDAVEAELSPEDKVAWIEAAREAGARVAFVGDGLNDGPALAAADVGVAMGSGAASSVLVADAVVGAPSLGPVVAGLRAARLAERVTRRNLWRSAGYNAVAVSLALAGLVNPLVAAVLMPLSSAWVLAASAGIERRLRRMEVEP